MKGGSDQVSEPPFLIPQKWGFFISLLLGMAARLKLKVIYLEILKPHAMAYKISFLVFVLSVVFSQIHAQEFKITASNGSNFDEFGASVDVDGDYALVGAPLTGNFAESAYVFKRNGSTWIEEAIVHSSLSSSFDEFATQVAISGSFILIGAPGEDSKGDGSGSAFVFRRNGSNWSQETELTPSDGSLLDAFCTIAFLSLLPPYSHRIREGL